MYFFDTYALIEMSLENPNYRRFADFTLVITPLNFGEFYAYLIRTYGKETATEKLGALSFKVLELKKEIMIEATEFKLAGNKKKFSWADCVGYVSAQQRGLKFLTGDSEFKNLPNVEFVK